MKGLVSETLGETENVSSFWKRLDIKDGIDVTGCDWKEVTALTLNSVRRRSIQMVLLKDERTHAFVLWSRRSYSMLQD